MFWVWGVSGGKITAFDCVRVCEVFCVTDFKL